MTHLSDRPKASSGAARGWPQVRAEMPVAAPGTSGSLATWVKARLTKALGVARAEEVFAATLQRMNREGLENPRDLLEFAELFIQQGGLLSTVGCSFKVHAMLRGAGETP